MNEQTTPTQQSVRAAVGYFILLSVWSRLLMHHRAAADLLDPLRRELLSEADQASYLAIRGYHGWHTIDLEEWREECAEALPEASCEGCGERVSCCQCDDSWSPARQQAICQDKLGTF